MNIKRWAVAAALLMAGCGSRVAYAMELNANFATPVEVQSPVSLTAGTTIAISTTGATPQNVVVNNTVAVSTTGTSPQTVNGTVAVSTTGATPQNVTGTVAVSTTGATPLNVIVSTTGATPLNVVVSTTGATPLNVVVSTIGVTPLNVVVSTTGATPLNVVVSTTGVTPLNVVVSTTGPSPQNTILNSGTLTGALPAGTNKIGGADLTGQVSSMTVVSVAGSTCTTAGSVSVPATGITEILATNAGRFHGEILNTSTTDLWVPQATTTAGNGMKVGPGATFTWDSTSPLYGVSGTGTIQVLTLDVTK